MLEKDSAPVVAAELELRLTDWPDGPLDDAVGPKLSVEFERGNGGVNPEAVGVDKLAKPVPDLVMKGVTVNERVSLDELTGLVGELLDRL